MPCPPRNLLTCSAAVLTALLLVSRVEAARDMEAAPAFGSGLEIVVMEVEGCLYCPIFRRDVWPVYLASPRARDVPLRFQDLNAAGAERLKLRAPIETVPTAVLVRDGVEAGRITGYVGPELFPRMVTDLLIGQR